MQTAVTTETSAAGRAWAGEALVVGMGRTGLSCARYLHGKGYRVRAVDSRRHPPMEAALRARLPEVALTSGALQPDAVADIDLCVVSPGVSPHDALVREARQRGIDVVGDVELFARATAAPVVAITGSNGKSTVTTLVGEMLRSAGLDVAVGGNIGVPVLDLLSEPTPAVYVLELSSFQLETTASLRPLAATVLNVSSDHMDRYTDLEAYARAKGRIFSSCATAVVNRDDARAAALAHGAPHVVSVGLGTPPGASDYGLELSGGSEWLVRGNERIVATCDLALAGRHNVFNALAACALAQTLGVGPEAMAAPLMRFSGLPHRAEVLGSWGGVRWVNDSKGTNVGATVAAISGTGTPVVLIAGGLGKGADFSPLRPVVERHVRAVVLFGRDAPLLEDVLAGTRPTRRAATLPQAVAVAAKLAQSGDTVLFSPACASFDMFDNFEHRGEVFRAAVREHHR